MPPTYIRIVEVANTSDGFGHHQTESDLNGASQLGGAVVGIVQGNHDRPALVLFSKDDPWPTDIDPPPAPQDPPR